MSLGLCRHFISPKGEFDLAVELQAPGRRGRCMYDGDNCLQQHQHKFWCECVCCVFRNQFLRRHDMFLLGTSHWASVLCVSFWTHHITNILVPSRVLQGYICAKNCGEHPSISRIRSFLNNLYGKVIVLWYASSRHLLPYHLLMTGRILNILDLCFISHAQYLYLITNYQHPQDDDIQQW